jgi:hypothetical protein
MDIDASREHLAARYPDLSGKEDARLVTAVASSDLPEAWRDIAVRLDQRAQPFPPVSAEDAEAALVLLAYVRKTLDLDEKRLLDIARDRGVTWPRIAAALELGSAQGAQQRRKRLDSVREYLEIDPSRRSSKAEG